MGLMLQQSSDGVFLNRCSNLSFKQLTSGAASPRMKFQAESVGEYDGFDFEFGNTHSLAEKSEEMDVFGRPASTVFADELFSNGRETPLKLPPRLEGVTSVVGSPLRSTSSGLKLAFQKMWSDDFDPFQKAAEKVREEDKKLGWSRRRRSRSVSPLRDYQWTIDDLNMRDQGLHVENYSESESKSCRWSQSNDKSTELQTETKINGAAEPRGLIIARKLRPLSMDQVTDIKQEQQPLNPVKEKKRHRVRRLLSRSATIAKEWSRAGDHSKEMSWKQSFGFKSFKKSNGNVTKSVSSEREIKTVVQYQYQPKMLLCMAFQNKLPGL